MVSAFASVARELLFNSDRSDEVIARILHRFHMPPSTMVGFAALLKGADALELAGVGRHLRLAVMTAYTQTWFTVQGCDDPCVSRRGTKAGDPLGDITFTLVVTRVLNEYAQRARAHGISVKLRRSPQEPCLAQPSADTDDIDLADDSYLDDALFLTTAPSPTQLLRQVGEQIRIVVAVFSSFALQLNFKPGKTEIAVVFHGKGAREARRQVCSTGSISVQLDDGTNVAVGVVHQYKHMGGISDPSCRMRPEMTARVRHATDSFKTLRPK